ncbi:MAG: hypothetical protein V4481_00645 [Patescibacteria group bacterium]
MNAQIPALYALAVVRPLIPAKDFPIVVVKVKENTFPKNDPAIKSLSNEDADNVMGQLASKADFQAVLTTGALLILAFPRRPEVQEQLRKIIEAAPSQVLERYFVTL